MEVFDIVDHEDRVVGQSSRADVHENGLYHRAVHILVQDLEGLAYLQRRSWNKDSAPGCWVSSCSGHVDAGEDYRRAAIRELREELGIEVPSEKLIEVGRHPAVPATGNEFVRLYLVREFRGKLTPDPEEILDGAWKTPAEIDLWTKTRPEDFARSFLCLWPTFQLSLD